MSEEIKAVEKRTFTREAYKYIFLDVVQFSKRKAEPQSEIVLAMNAIIRGILDKFGIYNEESTILIPTGDGMCIAYPDKVLQYDSALNIALEIQEAIFRYNEQAEDEKRRFQIRIGINQNIDILIYDINQNLNVAGAGITMAARIMDQGEGGHILISASVYDVLANSEVYDEKFRVYGATGKHGLKFKVYQYVGEAVGVNASPPAQFEEKAVAGDPPLTRHAAYYLAHAIRLQDFIVANRGRKAILVVILWSLAKDSYEKEKETAMHPYEPSIYGEGKKPLKEVVDFYYSTDIPLLYEFAYEYVGDGKLQPYVSCFEGQYNSPLIVNETGKKKLQEEFPDIWKEFNLDSPDSSEYFLYPDVDIEIEGK